MVKKSNALLASIFLVGVCMTLLIISYQLPWWGFNNLDYETDEDGKYQDYDEYGAGFTLGDRNGGVGYHTEDETTSIVYLITIFLLISAVIFCILFIVTALLYSSEKLKGIHLSVIFVVLVLLLCLLSPIFFMIATPMAREADVKAEIENAGGEYEPPEDDDPTKSFFGSNSEREDSYYGGDRVDKESWGGDIGWAMPFLAFVLALSGLILFILGKRKKGSDPNGHTQAATMVERHPRQQEDWRSPPPQRSGYDQDDPRDQYYDRGPRDDHYDSEPRQRDSYDQDRRSY